MAMVVAIADPVRLLALYATNDMHRMVEPGESNPRPTSNACSVLHAQSTIGFRPGADRGRPTLDLAL